MNKSFNKIKQIEKYIYENISEDLSLTVLAKRFEMNKYYLCHIFKEYMGYTLSQYIKFQRLLLVKKYYEDGMTLLDAALKAGFKNYSSFYKGCRCEFGEAPNKVIKSVGVNNE